MYREHFQLKRNWKNIFKLALKKKNVKNKYNGTELELHNEFQKCSIKKKEWKIEKKISELKNFRSFLLSEISDWHARFPFVTKIKKKKKTIISGVDLGRILFFNGLLIENALHLLFLPKLEEQRWQYVSKR